MFKNKALIISVVVVLLLIVGGFFFVQSRNQQAKDGAKNQLTIEQVAEQNGLNGKKCYVIVDKTVYDLSMYKAWSGGFHRPAGSSVKCGEDQSTIIDKAPHGRSVLLATDVVGTIQ